MNRRFLSSLLVASALGGQLLNAQAPAAAANADQTTVQAPENSDALSQLRARIAQQQEQIKKLQQAVDEQQKMLEQALAVKTAPAAANSASTTATATAAAPVTSTSATNDGTTVVATSNSGEPVKLVPAVNVKPDIATLPRKMQKDDSNVAASPLGIHIGNTTVTPFGFIDFIGFGRSTNAGSGIGSSFASIPYNTGLTGHISEFNESLQNTRLGFRVDSNYKGIDILGYAEVDFLGNQPTNIFQTTNSDVLRMRNIFADLKKDKLEILVGQDWSLFTPNRVGLSPIPSDIFYSQAVDTNYQAGLTWARQSQVRITYHPSESVAAAVSFENPQQFIGGFVTLPTALATPLANQLNTGSTTYSAPNVAPDILAKVAYQSKVFHIEAGGMVREFKTAGSAGTPVVYNTHSATGVAGEVNMNLNFNNKFRLLANTFFGDGGGRYIGGTAPDLIVRANGSLSPVHSYSTTDGFEYNPTKNNLIYSYYSGVAISRDTALDTTGKLIGYGYVGSPSADNKTIQEFTFGYSPTFFKSNNYGAFSMNFQYSYLFRDPWYVPAAGPKDAHLNLYYIDIRYTLP